jgi:hypothetical protein
MDAAGRIDRFQDHVDAVTGEMLCQFGAGAPGVDALFVAHGDDVHALRLGHSGSASPTARAAGRLKSHATVAVFSAKDLRGFARDASARAPGLEDQRLALGWSASSFASPERW